MSRDVNPLNVSPLIKGARWSFLIVGLYYGAHKKARLRAREQIEKPKRLAAFQEERLQHKIEGRLKTIAELKVLFKDLDLEPDPGWEDQV